MNYWHMQLHPDDKKWGQEKRLLEEKSLIGLGNWKDEEAQINNFKKMGIDDIVLIRVGKIAIALIQVISDFEDIGKDNNNNLDWFRYRRNIKVLEYADSNMGDFSDTRGTLKKLIDKKTISYNYIDRWYLKISQKDYLEEDKIDGSYKIKTIFIKNNQKQFQDFTIDFTGKKNKLLPLIVIAGKNGVGKTVLLEYLSELNVKNNDYIEVVSMNKTQEIEDNTIITSTSKIIHNMVGIQKAKNEYNKHIEYLPVEINKVQYTKAIIIKNFIKSSIELDSHKKALKTLKAFINNIFDEISIGFNIYDIDYTDRDNETIYFIGNNKQKFEIDSLSTGEKTLLSKVLYLYFKDIKNKIILIDEPELSLHPDWQNKVLKIYKNFANRNNCQIIIATHSPHIIGSAKSEYLRILDNDKYGNTKVLHRLPKSYGLEFNEVLTNIMNIQDTRTPDVSKKILLLKSMIINNDFDNNNFEKIWKSLENDLGEDCLDLSLLKLEIASRRKNA